MDKHELTALICVVVLALLIFIPVVSRKSRGEKVLRGEPIENTTSDKLYRQLMTECADCHKPGLWKAGPEGGIAQNIRCGHCGAEFNITSFGWAERIKR